MENKVSVRSSLEVVLEIISEYKEGHLSKEELDTNIIKFMKSKDKMSTSINGIKYYFVDYQILFNSRELSNGK